MKAKILIVGLLVLFSFYNSCFGSQASDSVNVYWTIGPGCWIKLKAHKDIDWGKISTFSPGEELVSDKNNLLHVVTNCQSYTLTAQVVDIQTPQGFQGSIPEDFYWKVERHPGGKVIQDWASLEELNMVNQPFLIETGGPGCHMYNLGYKYILDSLDIPGDYLVKFLYTVTAP